MGVGYGGDVTDIWETITSFYSGNIYPSYVLYKGILSVYPYVWFYELSKIFVVGSEKTLNLLVIIHTFYGTLQRRPENSAIYRAN